MMRCRFRDAFTGRAGFAYPYDPHCHRAE